MTIKNLLDIIKENKIDEMCEIKIGNEVDGYGDLAAVDLTMVSHKNVATREFSVVELQIWRPVQA